MQTLQAREARSSWRTKTECRVKMWCGPVGALSPTAACRGRSTKLSNCLTVRAVRLVRADPVVAAILGHPGPSRPASVYLGRPKV
jgi:hypothetical protein